MFYLCTRIQVQSFPVVMSEAPQLNEEGGRAINMENFPKSATVVATENVANATSENLNAAENAASINNSNSIQMERQNDPTVERATKIAIIDGEERKIVVAHTKYSMELPKDKKNLTGSLDRNKMLSCIYHLAKPEIFWDVKIPLLDENNQPIERGTENVYVLCPTSGTYWRVDVDEKLQHVEVHDFQSVQEYAQAIGCTNLYSRGLNNTEKIGVAALATGNEACQAVFDFAKEHKMSTSTAQHYLDYSIKPTMVLELMMGNTPKGVPTLGRTTAEAKELLDVVKEKFKKIAEKRYIIRPINTLLHMENKEYSLIIMKTAIKMLTEMETQTIEEAPNDQRETMVSSALTSYLDKLKREEKEAA